MSNNQALVTRQGADLAAADIEERQWRRLMREAEVADDRDQTRAYPTHASPMTGY